MSKKRLLTVAATDARRLAQFIAARLEVPHADARTLVESGRVYVAGRRVVDPRLALDAGVRVVVHAGPTTEPSPLRVIHEDAWLLVVEKPSGVPSQSTRSGEGAPLDAQVKSTRPGARLMHRLDRGASGLVLFAACAEACAPLQTALDDGKIGRRYTAVVSGRLEGEGEIRLRIGRVGGDSRLRQTLPEADPSGESARSRYRAVRHGRARTLVELELDTGRTHQLRVHLAAIGHAIIGDIDYGGAPGERLMLHAHELTLPDPRSGAPLALHAPVPPELLIALDLES